MVSDFGFSVVTGSSRTESQMNQNSSRSGGGSDPQEKNQCGYVCHSADPTLLLEHSSFSD